MVFPRLNGVWADLAPVLEPVGMAGMTVTIQAEDGEVEVHEHDLVVTRDQRGAFDGNAQATVSGGGRVKAVLDVGGIPADLEDSIVLPEQVVSVTGRVGVEQESEGFRVTLIDDPSPVHIEVESELAGRLVAFCGIATLGSPGCAGLDRSLRRIRLSLPEAGQSYWVGFDTLLPEERASIEACLSPALPAKRSRRSLDSK